MNTADGPVCGCEICEKIRFNDETPHLVVNAYLQNEQWSLQQDLLQKDMEIKELEAKVNILKQAIKALV